MRGVDKLCATYNAARHTRRLPMVVFHSIMNMAGVNSQVIYASNYSVYNVRRRTVLRNLVLSLTKDNLEPRSLQINVPPLVREKRQEPSGTSTKHLSEIQLENNTIVRSVKIHLSKPTSILVFTLL